jgi:hypothetical protein
MRLALPAVLDRLARSVELLVLAGIAWGILLAATADALGFSKEMGAFLGGLSLASTRYRDAIGARLVGLRDFLLLFFFVRLGADLEVAAVAGQIGRAGVLSLFVLAGNPLIVMAIMGAMGYRRRTGFLTGLTVAQISEFSLVLGALGVTLHHIGRDVLGLVTLVGIVTIGLSTYLILYSHPIYARLAPWLGLFERRVPFREGPEEAAASADVIVFGLGRFGSSIARGLATRGRKVLGVDFDPFAVAAARRDGLEARYGDAEDPEGLHALPLAGASWVVSSTPQWEVNRGLIRALRGAGFAGRVAITAHSQADARAATEAGADLVFLPFVDAAHEAVDRILRWPGGAGVPAPRDGPPGGTPGAADPTNVPR